MGGSTCMCKGYIRKITQWADYINDFGGEGR